MSRDKEIVEGVVRDYLSGVDVRTLGERCGYSEQGIVHILRDQGVEKFPAGRPGISAALRVGALNYWMVNGGGPPSGVCSILNIGESTFFRVRAGTLRDEPGARAVGTIVFDHTGERILVHTERYPQLLKRLVGENSTQLTWRQKTEPSDRAIRRLIESEIYGAKLDIAFPEVLEKIRPDPVVKMLLANVLVEFYVLQMTQLGERIPFRSEKVADVRWVEIDKLDSVEKWRVGVKEVLDWFLARFYSSSSVDDRLFIAHINQQVKQFCGASSKIIG